jgi:hypothetical protein
MKINTSQQQCSVVWLVTRGVLCCRVPCGLRQAYRQGSLLCGLIVLTNYLCLSYCHCTACQEVYWHCIQRQLFDKFATRIKLTITQWLQLETLWFDVSSWPGRWHVDICRASSGSVNTYQLFHRTLYAPHQRRALAKFWSVLLFKYLITLKLLTSNPSVRPSFAIFVRRCRKLMRRISFSLRI